MMKVFRILIILCVFSVIGCGGIFEETIFGDVTFINVSSESVDVYVSGHSAFTLSAAGDKMKITINSNSIQWTFVASNVRYEESANGDNVYFIFFDE
jgi:hypothetical protein